ncbi:hypothetical protein G4G28_07985 [Massilia sp. Dwa41.01b]|uniref:hypothetical protein n=1 Tax=unclassified Massilia TaxID=2609279 RepID=UPI0015FF5A85|nr:MULTISPECIES: hypothetical protein [unclassified Massilia]QNA88446.1 hypothetical protein G4G28_07985 [Massilia sp. Dwa41.01b]QNA99339.1 hypothetical protein G4G31_11655 [Massilia sp. Se16.2.3]
MMPQGGNALLRMRLALRATSALLLAAVLLCAAALALLAWVLPARDKLERERAEAADIARRPPTVAAHAPVVDNAAANLALFQAALGNPRHLERELKTLFDLAAKSGLLLRQGEYKSGYDRNARLATYQVSLPVKGSYAQVWQFALLALRAIPFASLDEVSFRREAIGEPTVEARLRLTLYLQDTRGAP